MKTRRELLVSALGAACAATAGRLAGTGTPWAQDPAPPPGSRRSRPGRAPRRIPPGGGRPCPESRVACGLCFRGCRISEGARGHCGVRENRGGALKTLVHSRPAALALDPIEKKPFFHVLPGASALSLGTAGCNFHCRWCQNWEISQARPEEVPASTRTPEDVAALAVRRGASLVACTYSEPTVFAEYVLDIAVASRKAGAEDGRRLERRDPRGAAPRPLRGPGGVQGRPEVLLGADLPRAVQRRPAGRPRHAPAPREDEGLDGDRRPPHPGAERLRGRGPGPRPLRPGRGRPGDARPLHALPPDVPPDEPPADAGRHAREGPGARARRGAPRSPTSGTSRGTRASRRTARGAGRGSSGASGWRRSRTAWRRAPAPTAAARFPASGAERSAGPRGPGRGEEDEGGGEQAGRPHAERRDEDDPGEERGERGAEVVGGLEVRGGAAGALARSEEHADGDGEERTGGGPREEKEAGVRPERDSGRECREARERGEEKCGCGEGGRRGEERRRGGPDAARATGRRRNDANRPPRRRDRA